jgi:kynurenine 3-monooxygenase
MEDQKVVIVGGGLAGSLLAIFLARRGIYCDVFETRPDLRKISHNHGRSINLALSARGIAALKEVGLSEVILAKAVPMKGRMIYENDDKRHFIAYSGRKYNLVYSISRLDLNIEILNEASKYPEIQFFFNERCIGYDCARGKASFATGRTLSNEIIIATDGASSLFRHSMAEQCPNFIGIQDKSTYGYKELHIPPGCLNLKKNALHIWPRDMFMMIALPNLDESFTCTLFAHHKGKDGFSTIEESNNKHQVLQLFMEKNFSDILADMPEYQENFFNNPTGHLGAVKCLPWHLDGKLLLVEDSAHAILPFFGQGMNCAFEDCRILDQLLNKKPSDWEDVFQQFCSLRKKNTDAIADLSTENFLEMRKSVSDPVFCMKRELDLKLEKLYPEYHSKYSMVTFCAELPYSIAKKWGNAQDKFLMNLCQNTKDVSSFNLEWIMQKILELRQ